MNAHRFRAAWDDARHLVLAGWLYAQEGEEGVSMASVHSATLVGFHCKETACASNHSNLRGYRLRGV